MTWPANIDVRLLQAERDLTRAERRTELAQQAAARARKELDCALAALMRERDETARLRGALDGVYASTSWRLSSPVRALSRFAAAINRGSQPGLAMASADEPPTSPELPALPRREALILQRLRRDAD